MVACIYNDDESTDDSLLDDDFSVETTEYELSDSELLYPSRHYDTIGYTLKSDKCNKEPIDEVMIDGITYLKF
jgi:hypothetical protein